MRGSDSSDRPDCSDVWSRSGRSRTGPCCGTILEGNTVVADGVLLEGGCLLEQQPRSRRRLSTRSRQLEAGKMAAARGLDTEPTPSCARSMSARSAAFMQLQPRSTFCVAIAIRRVGGLEDQMEVSWDYIKPAALTGERKTLTISLLSILLAVSALVNLTFGPQASNDQRRRLISAPPSSWRLCPLDRWRLSRKTIGAHIW